MCIRDRVMVHAQLVRKEQLKRMAAIQMMPSFFIAHTFYWGDIHLKKDVYKRQGVKIPVKAKKPAQKRADAAFERLLAAGRRLLEVIHKNEGLANKDKAKFESQINNLSDKWDRWE